MRPDRPGGAPPAGAAPADDRADVGAPAGGLPDNGAKANGPQPAPGAVAPPPPAPGQPWLAPDATARPFHRLLDAAARDAGARLEVEPVFRHLARLAWPDGTRRPLFGNALGLNADAAAALAADKTYAADVMSRAGLPV